MGTTIFLLFLLYGLAALLNMNILHGDGDGDVGGAGARRSI